MVGRFASLGSLLLLATAGAALADRQFGWCNGVGNPHQSAYCGGGVHPPVVSTDTVAPPGGQVTPGATVGIQTPPSTQLPQQPQTPVPQAVVIPVLPPAQIPPTGGPAQGPVTQPQPYVTVGVTVSPVSDPTITTVTQGGGPVQLPPVVVTMQPQPRPIPSGGGTVPAVTVLEVPPMSYISHQITVGAVNVPQVVINATGTPALAIPGQITLTPVAIPVPRPPAGTVAPQPQQPPLLVPPMPGIPIPTGTPTAQTPAAVMVPVIAPSLPPGTGATPQGVPDPMRPGQVLVPVLIPPIPGGTGPIPQGVPNPQLPSQVLVPVLLPPWPAKPDPVLQGVPDPQVVGPMQPPALRPTVTIRPQPPQVIAAVIFNRPKPRPHVVPPTTILQPVVTHSTSVTRPPVGTNQITDRPGRQTGGSDPSFADRSGGANWNCVASGVGVRQIERGGRIITTGVERHVGKVDSLGRDVPAKHPKHPHCIISVQRRDGD